MEEYPLKESTTVCLYAGTIPQAALFHIADACPVIIYDMCIHHDGSHSE
jgi:hypothetical protein